MHPESWESTREAFEQHEAKPTASLASRVLYQLPKCIYNTIDARYAWIISFRTFWVLSAGEKICFRFIEEFSLAHQKHMIVWKVFVTEAFYYVAGKDKIFK